MYTQRVRTESFNFREKETIEINFSHLFFLQMRKKSQIVTESGLESVLVIYLVTKRAYSKIGETRTCDLRLSVP